MIDKATKLLWNLNPGANFYAAHSCNGGLCHSQFPDKFRLRIQSTMSQRDLSSRTLWSVNPVPFRTCYRLLE